MELKGLSQKQLGQLSLWMLRTASKCVIELSDTHVRTDILTDWLVH